MIRATALSGGTAWSRRSHRGETRRALAGRVLWTALPVLLLSIVPSHVRSSETEHVASLEPAHVGSVPPQPARSLSPAVAPPEDKRKRQVSARPVGFATYYARRFDGRVTASGVRFDTDAMVAAHPSYPFGTVVRVTNLRNGRSVRVRIVDRGPARGPRREGVIIDLSRAAAESLGFIRAGRTRVRLDVLSSG